MVVTLRKFEHYLFAANYSLSYIDNKNFICCQEKSCLRHFSESAKIRLFS